MVLSSWDALGMGLKSSGYSENSNNLKELNEVEELLIIYQPQVANFGYITLDEN